ncbi:GNAT family N-acetyltransferase [Myroides odoratimimus]|uniref:GNAT family N-acetyltransferase n=1 Tax=Myroides odoratimimus TaxID=76832 RepID=UPI0031018166
MKIRSLREASVCELTEVFNDSFSDYILPFHLTEDSLAFKLTSDLVDLDYSIGVFDKDKLVAFMLTGVKRVDEQPYFYNAGTGVRIAYRGQRLVAQMYSYAIPIWKETGNTVNLSLEVIKGNDKAIRAYKAQGYNISRDLLCFKGQPREVHYKTANIVVEDVEQVCWNTVLPFWDIQPSWQNSIVVLEKIKEDIRYKVAKVRGNIVGYVVYHKSNGKIFQLAVDKAYRNKGIAKILVNDVVNILETPILITNVDDKGVDVISFLKRIGLEHYITQHEMVMKL